MGFDGMVAKSPTDSEISSSSANVEAATDANKQYSASVRMADASDRFNLSDLQGVQTQRYPQPRG